MNQGPTVLMNFKDLPREEDLRVAIEARCQRMATEFSEITRFEFTLGEDGNGFTAHGHVTGKNTDVATQAVADELGQAADRLLDKVERQLRRAHRG
jgi:ribosome-associated translation inhibitor RaiA